jgi:hypothetical protein
MPNISVQLRRGTDTEHSSFAGAEGEVTVDTTNDTLHVHTGGGAGTGVRLAKHSELPAGGGGTVVSIASGTGLTGGPITTSGTLSLASIANLRALGNVSGSNAAPTEVEIKDEDAMTSNSATALATQQSIKAYVDAQVVSKWDSGWIDQDDQGTPVSVGNGATMILDHDLGDAALGAVFSVYAAEDASGTNRQQQLHEIVNISNSQNPRGITITDITNTTITAQLAPNGYTINSSGLFANVDWGTGTGDYSHIRVVLVG